MTTARKPGSLPINYTGHYLCWRQKQLVRAGMKGRIVRLNGGIVDEDYILSYLDRGRLLMPVSIDACQIQFEVVISP